MLRQIKRKKFVYRYWISVKEVQNKSLNDISKNKLKRKIFLISKTFLIEGKTMKLFFENDFEK